MLSLWWMRRIASPKSGATETTSTRGESGSGCVSIESVTSSLRIALCSRRFIEPGANTPCETAA